MYTPESCISSLFACRSHILRRSAWFIHLKHLSYEPLINSSRPSGCRSACDVYVCIHIYGQMG